VPIALQIVFALVTIFGICGVLTQVEISAISRWLIKHDRNAEALAVVSALDDAPPCGQTDARIMQYEAAIVEDILSVAVTKKGVQKDKAFFKGAFSGMAVIKISGVRLLRLPSSSSNKLRELI
jgi:hypothetical protein